MSISVFNPWARMRMAMSEAKAKNSERVVATALGTIALVPART